MNFDEIERCCQLHEEVYVYYHVTGYTVGLWTHDGGRCVVEASGSSLLHAMLLLNERLASETLESVRAMKHGEVVIDGEDESCISS